jgi:hypothetical protein
MLQSSKPRAIKRLLILLVFFLRRLPDAMLGSAPRSKAEQA